jgi:hypothetical protein
MWKMSPEEKSIRRRENLKIIITAFEIVLIVLAVIAVVLLYTHAGFAEDYEEGYEIRYAICTKGDRVNVRPFPNTKSEPSGWLEPGDVVYLDGKKRNGFCHCVGLNTEAGDGWVHKGYLVDDPPELVNRTGVIAARSKVKARKNVGGARTRWLKPGGTVRVSYWSDIWCVTDCGYVMSKYIELDGE